MKFSAAGQRKVGGDVAAGLRRWLVILAAVLAVAAALHLADHAIRGEIVEDHNLIADWNHSGWPFRNQVTPFTPALAIPLLFIGGILLTLGGRMGGGSWLVFAIVIAAVVVGVHFVPGPQTETMGVIYRTYGRGGWSPVVGVLAVLNVAMIAVGLVALATLAFSFAKA